MDWKQLLAYITGSVDQALLLRNEYVITENRILRQQIPGRVRLDDEERKRLAEIGQKLGKQALAEVAIGAGFHDQAHFTRHFKRHLGVTPGKYLRASIGKRPGTSPLVESRADRVK